MKPLTVLRTLRIGWRARWNVTAIIILPVYSICSVVPINQILADTPPPDSSIAHAPQVVHVNKSRPKGAEYRAVGIAEQPSDQDITLSHAFAEPLVPVGGETTPDENAALGLAINTFLKHSQDLDTTALSQFITAHPNSAWRVALDLNLAQLDYRAGAFSEALDTWQDAWDRSKGLTDKKGVQLANLAAGELAEMNARIGRMSDLEALFSQTKGRSASGSAGQLLAAANSGLWVMKHHPEKAFRCGPFALEEILMEIKGKIEDPGIIHESVSTTKGISLSDVQKLSRKLGLSMQMAKHTSGSVFPTPSVVNWKLGHYAAVIRARDGKYEVHDITFGKERFLVSVETLEQESSGYFLIPSGPLPEGWSAVSASEGSSVFGKGDPITFDGTSFGVDAVTLAPQVETPGGDCGSAGLSANDLQGGATGSGGMTVPSVKAMLVSLTLSDTPISYSPPVGPSMPFAVTYNQKDNTQPITFSYSNLGPGWTFGFCSYMVPGSSTTTVYERGGGIETFAYNSSTSSWYPSQITQEVLTKVNSTTWTRTFPTGDVETYGMSDSSGRFWLTAITDPEGNSMTLSYDSNLRLTAITDALGQVTSVTYESNTASNLPNFYLISQVTDPFGRSANFAYNSSGELQSVTDVLGITSQYLYTTTGFINSLTTPYGQTTFTYSDGSTDPLLGVTRRLDITYPDGNTTRTEYNDSVQGTGAPGIPNADPAGIPSGMYSGITSYNSDMANRNTFFWDKQAFKSYAGNYAKARILHWLDDVNSNECSQIEESHKYAEQNRIWFGYAGEMSSRQVSATMLGHPTQIGRILDNGTSQIFTYAYNAIGKITKRIDPLGRETDYTYATNNIDLLTVKQKNGAGSDLLNTFTYNNQHEVLTETNSAGQETIYTYEPNGEIATVTGPTGATTTYNYNGSGYLTSVVGAISGTSTSFTYDGYGRVSTTTDSQGYVITLNYDAADRLTQVSFPDGTTNQTIYQNLDAVYSKDRLGRWLRTFYDSIEEPISVIDSSGSSVTTKWTPAGQVQSRTDPLGHTVSWTFDDQNRPITKTYPDGSYSSITYENTTSRVKSTTDVAGQVTTRTYNLDNTVSQVVYTNAAVATPTVSFTYDTVYPRVLTMVDGTGTTTYNYNSIAGTVGSGLIGSMQTPLATLSYTYDQLGREVGEKINDSATGQGLADNSASMTYDALGRISAVTNALSGGGSFGYSYLNATGRLTSVTTPTGPSTSYTYQDSSTTTEPRLTEIKNLNASSAVVSKFDYAYNADGKITTWTQQTDSADPQQWAMGYDSVGRLTSVGVTDTVTSAVIQTYGYTYDANGNRTNAQVGVALYPAQSNVLNQYVAVTGPVNEVFAGSLSKPGTVAVAGVPATMDGTYTNFQASVAIPSGGSTNNVPVVATSANGYATTNAYQVVVPPSSASPSYDANGNLTSDSKGSYTWDAKGDLVKITYPDTSYSTFTYNGSGQRVALCEYDSTPAHNLTSTNQFISGALLGEERSASNNVTKRFFAQGEQQISGSAVTSYYYTRDHLGSVREMTDTTGAVQARYSYDPYGQRSIVSGSAGTEIGFAGYFYHSTSGLYLSPTRAYNATTGRWISRDPSGEKAGLNLYAYCGDDPVNNVDPMGLFIGWDDLAFAAGGAVAGVVAQAITNYVTGKSGGYGAAIAGGVAGGLTLLYTANPIAAGAAAVLIQDGLKGSAPQTIATDMAVAAVVGKIIPSPEIEIPGITAGRGSASAVTAQIVTKAQNGTISTVTNATLTKMIVAEALDQGQDAPRDGLTDGLKDILKELWEPEEEGECQLDDAPLSSSDLGLTLGVY